MAITVTHSKVSAIPDSGDDSLIEPSDWNATHTLTGLGTMAEQDANNVAITGGTISGVAVTGYVPTTETITAGTGLTGGGDLSANRTIALANTAVTTGTYGTASRNITQTVDQQGRLTNIFDQPIEIANTQVTGLGTASTKDAGVALGVATLDAAGKVPLSEIPDSIIGALSYQGTWNATTNTPTLISSVGVKGYYYVVSVAGTTNLNGITDWQIGDWAVFDGLIWEKIDNTDGVTSVNGFTGAVVLTTTNIAEGTNEYFTTAKARASVSAGTGISYNSTTGVITNSLPSLGGDVVGPASATDNAIARFDTTTGKLIQNSVVTIDDAGNEAGINSINFDTTPTTVPTTPGSLYWDSANGNQTLSLVMANGDAIQQIGEETYFRIRASAAITEGQVVMFTGTIGGSGALTGAPASGLTATTASYVMGIATHNLAINDWGYITSFGLVRGIDTTGGAEAWVDGQILYYNPAVAGGLTKTVPVAPNAKIQVCAVVNAASGGSGSVFVRPTFGGALGQYEGDVQVTTPANGDLLIRNQTSGKWVNAPLTAGTNVTITNSAGGVTIAAAGGLTVTDDTSTNATRYLTFTSATSGSITGINTASTELKFNPSLGILDFSGMTGAITAPTGTTAQRPATPVAGMMRQNSDLGQFEVYDNGQWQQLTTTTYTVSYLSVAGGGGGGAYFPGVAGGAAGGAGGVLTGTSIGGGYGGGGNPGSAGGSGGSGGGGAGNSTGTSGGAGTSGQGYAGGSGSNGYVGGGGGGAGEVGDPGSNYPSAINGGDGISSSINGTATYYGGGGSGFNGTGGAGGGGAYRGDGTAGSGGGGGSSSDAAPSGSGGSGVFIIAYPSATQRGTGGTVTTYTSGSTNYYVHTFTTSGTYTA